MDESAPDVNHGQTGPVAFPIRTHSREWTGPAKAMFTTTGPLPPSPENAMSQGLAAQVFEPP
jgi:hypothetical protein